MLKTSGYHSAITGRDPKASASLEASIPAVGGVKGVKPHDRNRGIISSRVCHTGDITAAHACTCVYTQSGTKVPGQPSQYHLSSKLLQHELTNRKPILKHHDTSTHGPLSCF